MLIVVLTNNAVRGRDRTFKQLFIGEIGLDFWTAQEIKLSPRKKHVVTTPLWEKRL